MRRLVRTVVPIALFVSIAASTRSAAQSPIDPHAVQPERPTVATHAGTVAPGWIEVEAGAEFDRFLDRTHGASLPIVTKIGVAANVQMSIVGIGIRPPGEHGLGFGDLGVGVKWRFFDKPGPLGRFAIHPSVKLPTGSSDAGTGTGTTDVGVLVISSHDLGPVALDLNAGYTRRSGNGAIAPRNATVWTISFGGPAAGSVGWVAELYGYPATSGPAGAASIVAVLFGPTLQLRRWLAFDAGAIIRLTGPQPRAFYVGGVYNIGRAW
jgi:outer membrane putative beta-barrel porin/alpha-amylase